MTQQIINTGNSINDRTGDQIRTAFNKVNNNFTELYSAGPANSQVRIANNVISTTVTNANLVLNPNGIGAVIVNNTILPSIGNIYNLGSSAQPFNNLYVTNFTSPGNLVISGNVTVAGNLAVIGTSTSLVTKSSGLVNRGVDITLGTLRARIPSSGNVSLQVSTVSGTYTVYGSGVIVSGGVTYGYIDGGTPLSVTTTPAYLKSSTNFSSAGNTESWMIMDTGNNISWRISLIIGTSFNNNMISIERLVQ